jgi:NAD(P)-dependent dehydrogenase (short-subunit alcohol dehydrogenase family)
MKRFENHNIVVTGSSEGVGRTIAVEFAKEGARVLLVNRRKPEQTMEMIQEAGGKPSFIICDITDEKQVVEMGKKAEKY